MWRHIAANAMTFLIVALFLLVGGISWGVREYRAPGPLTAAICLPVPAGSANTDALTSASVSYTHLTLPTIYSV